MGVTDLAEHDDIIRERVTSAGDKTRAAILREGLALWRDDPASVSARRIGKRLGMTHSGVLFHYGSSAALRDAIAAHAVASGDRIVIPMLIASRHAATVGLTASQRAGYLAGVAQSA